MYCTRFPDFSSSSIFYCYLCFQSTCPVKVRHGAQLLHLSVAYLTVFALKGFQTDFNSSLCFYSVLSCASWLKCGFNFFNCIYRSFFFFLTCRVSKTLFYNSEIWKCNSVIEYLSRIHETLGSVPYTTKNKIKLNLRKT